MRGVRLYMVGLLVMLVEAVLMLAGDNIMISKDV